MLPPQAAVGLLAMREMRAKYVVARPFGTMGALGEAAKYDQDFAPAGASRAGAARPRCTRARGPSPLRRQSSTARAPRRCTAYFTGA